MPGRGSGAPLLEGVDDETLTRVMTNFYDRMLADERVAHYFISVNVPRLKAHQRTFLLAALAGPELVNTLRLEHAHQPLRLEDEHFDIAVAHLAESLVDAGIRAPIVAAVSERLQPLREHIVAGSVE